MRNVTLKRRGGSSLLRGEVNESRYVPPVSIRYGQSSTLEFFETQMGQNKNLGTVTVHLFGPGRMTSYTWTYEVGSGTIWSDLGRLGVYTLGSVLFVSRDGLLSRVRCGLFGGSTWCQNTRYYSRIIKFGDLHPNKH